MTASILQGNKIPSGGLASEGNTTHVLLQYDIPYGKDILILRSSFGLFGHGRNYSACRRHYSRGYASGKLFSVN